MTTILSYGNVKSALRQHCQIVHLFSLIFTTFQMPAADDGGHFIRISEKQKTIAIKVGLHHHRQYVSRSVGPSIALCCFRRFWRFLHYRSGQSGEFLTVLVHLFFSRIYNGNLTPNPTLTLSPPLNLT